jgi:hypothetical protein
MQLLDLHDGYCTHDAQMAIVSKCYTSRHDVTELPALRSVRVTGGPDASGTHGSSLTCANGAHVLQAAPAADASQMQAAQEHSRRSVMRRKRITFVIQVDGGHAPERPPDDRRRLIYMEV